MDRDNESVDRSLLDEIGPWSERKHEIVQYYMQTYSNILDGASSKGLKRFYIDGYAAAGYSISKATGDLVRGSALRALGVEPPFDRYFFVEKNVGRYRELQKHCRSRTNVEVINGDANTVLREHVFPRVRYERRERAFCFLDPYNEVSLEWETIRAAGETNVIDVLIHFPISSINRSVLKTYGNYSEDQARRLTLLWGTAAWENLAYDTLLFDDLKVKVTNERLVAAFKQHLEADGAFSGTSDPIPMKNGTNSVLYYLIFASNHQTGVKAIRSVANHFIKKGS